MCVKVSLLAQPSPYDSARQTIHIGIGFGLARIALDNGDLLIGIMGGRLKLYSTTGSLEPAGDEVRRSVDLIPSTGAGILAATKVHAGASCLSLSGGFGVDSEISVATQLQLAMQRNPDGPSWEFEASLPGALSGHFAGQAVAEVTLEGKSEGEVRAEFDTSARALWIAGSETLWPAGLKVNQRIVRRLLVWRWLRSRLRDRTSLTLTCPAA